MAKSSGEVQGNGSATVMDTVVRGAGWDGRCFEDCAVGDRYEHPFGRTVPATDDLWLALLTQNAAPLHVDRHHAGQTGGRQPVDGMLTLALVTRQCAIAVAMRVFADLAWHHVELPHPVFVGDTISSRSLVLDVGPSEAKPQVGLVRVGTEGCNQDGVTVIRVERTVMVYRRGEGQAHARPAVKDAA